MKAMKGYKRALAIIQANEIVLPSQLAPLLWPDSPKWKRVYKCGPYGASQGIAMNRAAGALLGRLRQAGLIEGPSYWPGHYVRPASLTASGRALLEGETLQDKRVH
jgi:hypothetical protein